MNILYITTVFPESIETSTIYTDLAEELSKMHDVTVLTNIERKRNKKTYLSQERNCEVLRVRTGNQYNVNLIEKGITLVTLNFLMKRALKKYLRNKKYDLILYESPPVTLSNVVLYAKKLYKAKTFLMLKDIFPQNAVDLKIMNKHSLIYKYFRLQEKRLYAVSDKIGCMSNKNLQYINENNDIESNKLTIFENTKKYIKFHCIQNKEILMKYGIPTDKIIFVFGGNMGRPQGIEFLGDCIIDCEKINEAFFVLVGRGTEKEKIKKKLSYVNNAIVLDNLPRDDYEQLLTLCDVGIISLDYRFTIPNYPSRILSYMEYRKPVIALTDLNTDFKELIFNSDCGFWSPSNSTKLFKENVIKLLDKNVRIEKGLNGFKYFLNNLTTEKSVIEINSFLKESGIDDPI